MTSYEIGMILLAILTFVVSLIVVIIDKDYKVKK